MKGLCVSLSGDKAEFTVIGKKPEPGFYYSLEEYHNGTASQNRFFHLLVSEYFNSGMHSYDSTDMRTFKKQIKRHLGEGFESVAYSYVVEEEEDRETKYKPRMAVVEKYSDIPEEIRSNPEIGLMTKGILKSWSAYSLAQRKRTINNLVTEMMEAGVNSKRFNEILLDMQSTEEKVKEIFQ